MDAWSIGLIVLIIAGLGAIIFGALWDRRRNKRRAAEMLAPPARSIPQFHPDSPAPHYLSDLQAILDRGWLHKGSIAVADNVRIPGAPRYRKYMREQQNKLWRTVEHKTHVEYQTLIPDLVLESEYLGD